MDNIIRNMNPYNSDHSFNYLFYLMKYAVIDFLWYRKYVDGAYTDSYGFDNIDEWGRPFPDVQRFPSSRVDRGFSQIASKVHAMGLKFGIHLMKGISVQAVNANTPILDIKTVMFLL